MTIVIGLHGAKGSGKDYFFKVVKQQYPNRDIRKIAFADPIKHKVMFLFGLQSESEYDLFKRSYLTYNVGRDVTHDGRHVVREVGMMMRDYDPQQFVRYVDSTIKASPNSIWCITDLRFNNELDFLKATKSWVVKIKRIGVDYDGHITETEFDSDVCDYEITNNASLEAYENKVVEVFDNIVDRSRS